MLVQQNYILCFFIARRYLANIVGLLIGSGRSSVPPGTSPLPSSRARLASDSSPCAAAVGLLGFDLAFAALVA